MEDLKAKIAENEFWRFAKSDGYSGATLDSVAVAEVIKVFMANSRRYDELLTLQDRYNAQDSLLASVLETNQTLCKRLKEQEQALTQLKAKEE